MTKYFFLALLCVSFDFLTAQNSFEGQATITYKAGKEDIAEAQLTMKGAQVYLKQTKNGNSKYDGFLLNLATKDFYTISTADKKVIIKYNFDKLTNFYEAHKLKEGYREKYGVSYKTTDKVKEENGIKLTKSVGENEQMKITEWTGAVTLPLNELIPLLRLMGNWNEADGGTEPVLAAEVSHKATKNETSVAVKVKREKIADSTFKLPEGYLQKDFAKLMEEDKGNGKLIALVQTFFGF